MTYLNIDVIAGSFLLLGLLELLDADHVVDHDRVWGVEEGVQALRDLSKLHPLRLEDLLEIRVAVDKLLLVRVLQLVGLDVLPQGVDDDRPGLGVHPEQAGQPRVQLELERLVVEQQEDRAAHRHVPGSLHLEAVRLLGGRGPVPLHQVVVRSVQVLVQLNHQRLEEGGELPLGSLVLLHPLVLVNQPPLDPQLPAGARALLALLGGEAGVGNENSQLTLLLHGPFESLLNVQSLSHDGRVEFPLKLQKIHVGLGFRHKFTNFLRENLVSKPLLLLGRLGALRRRSSHSLGPARRPHTRPLSLGQ